MNFFSDESVSTNLFPQVSQSKEPSSKKHQLTGHVDTVASELLHPQQELLNQLTHDEQALSSLTSASCKRLSKYQKKLLAQYAPHRSVDLDTVRIAISEIQKQKKEIQAESYPSSTAESTVSTKRHRASEELSDATDEEVSNLISEFFSNCGIHVQPKASLPEDSFDVSADSDLDSDSSSSDSSDSSALSVSSNIDAMFEWRDVDGRFDMMKCEKIKDALPELINKIKQKKLSPEQQELIDKLYIQIFRGLILHLDSENKKLIFSCLERLPLSSEVLLSKLKYCLSWHPEIEKRVDFNELIEAFHFTPDQKINMIASFMYADTATQVFAKYQLTREEKMKTITAFLNQEKDIIKLFCSADVSFLTEAEKINFIIMQMKKFHNVLLIDSSSFRSSPIEQFEETEATFNKMKISSQQEKLKLKKEYYPTISSGVALIKSDSSISQNEKDILLDDLAKTNPVMLFENWHLLGEADQKRIQASSLRIPYFDIEEQLIKLAKEPDLTIDQLTPLLEQLHSLNKTKGIPLRFYLPNFITKKSLPHALNRLIGRLVRKCSTQKDLLDIVTALSKNFFVGTNSLLANLYKKATFLFPELERLFTLHEQDDPSPQIKTPFLTAAGAQLLVSSKLEKKGISLQEHQVEAFYYDEIEAKVNEFSRNARVQTATFLVYFGTNRNEPAHYAPLYLKKEPDGGVNVLCSESLGEEYAYRNKILKELALVKDIPHLHIYMTQKQRQKDFYSCVVFTIRDLIEAVNCEQQGLLVFQPGAPTLGKVVEAELPSNFLKICQDFPTIREKNDQFISRTEQIREPLEAYVQRHTYMAPKFSESEILSIPFIKRNLLGAEKEAKWFLETLEMLQSSGPRYPYHLRKSSALPQNP